MAAGTLFVVATPIGNLEDVTLRALRTLKDVHLIAAEDTRRTAKLLARYEIRTPLVSLHAHNEYRMAPRLVDRLSSGEDIALVSDAGTPGIADPGQYLVRRARERGIRVTPVPGPSAVTAALSVSGLNAGEFVFMGFPPRSGQARAKWLDRVEEEPRTVIFFEVPHRINQLIGELAIILVNRQIEIHRELSKIHESYVISPMNTTLPSSPSKGEIVVIVGEQDHLDGDVLSVTEDLEKAASLFDCMTTQCSIDASRAETAAAFAFGVRVSRLRAFLKRRRFAERQRPGEGGGQIT